MLKMTKTSKMAQGHKSDNQSNFFAKPYFFFIPLSCLIPPGEVDVGGQNIYPSPVL